MKTLYFVRHGQTEWNAIRRMQGQWNSDLNDIGRHQADINGQFLKPLDIEYLVASPLDRTTQTAEIINQHLNLDVIFDDRLKEWDCGDWSGEMWDDVGKKWPEEFAQWQADQYSYRGPNCENYPDMIQRSSPFLTELMALPYDRIAVVSHGMIGRVMVSTMLKHTPDEMFEYSQTNDTVFQLTETDGAGHFIVQHFVGGGEPEPGLPPRHY